MLFSEFVKQVKLHQPQALPSLYIFTGSAKLVGELKDKGLELIARVLAIPFATQMDKKSSLADEEAIKRFNVINFNESEFWTELYVVPFLNKTRLVVLNVADKTDLISQIDKSLIEYISNKSFFTRLVIFIDRWEKYSAELGKLVGKKAWLIECQPLVDSDLPRWIITQLNIYGKKISLPDAKLLADRTGNDLSRIDAVIQKLVLFHKDTQVIPSESICNFVDFEKEYDIRELGNAIINKQPDRALMISRQLLKKGEPVNKIIGFLRWFFTYNFKYQKNTALLAYYYRRLLAVDLAIKTGRLPDDLALQMLVIKLSAAGKAQ